MTHNVLMESMAQRGAYPPPFVIEEWEEGHRQEAQEWALDGSIDEVPEHVSPWMFDGKSETLERMFDDSGMGLNGASNDWSPEKRMEAFHWLVVTSLMGQDGKSPMPPPHVVEASGMELPIFADRFTFLVGSLCPRMDSAQTYSYLQQVVASVQSSPGERTISLYLTDTVEGRTALILHTLWSERGKTVNEPGVLGFVGSISMSVLQHDDAGIDAIHSERYSFGHLDSYRRLNDLNSDGPAVWAAKFKFEKCVCTVGRADNERIFEFRGEMLPNDVDLMEKE